MVPRVKSLSLIILLVFSSATLAFAHNVTEGDAGYIQEIWGVHLIPFLYLGAKHMVTGYDHILFLFGVVFFLYRMREVELMSAYSPLVIRQRCYWGSCLAGE